MSRSKGSRREREAVRILGKAGYATYRPATVAYGENDPFGLFDILAFAPHRPPRFVQVKSNVARNRESWFNQARLFAAHGILTEMWCCHDREGWRVIQRSQQGTETVYDGRKDNTDMGDGLIDWLRCSE